jgi:uncharacterized membrane protein YhaH (DUF805 family)
MQTLRFLFSPSGRLRPRDFIVAALAVYAAGVASQWLTSPGLVAGSGLLPFAVVQVLLIWVWFSLHTKRLRDADRSLGLAVAASIFYFLFLTLLLYLLGAFFGDASTHPDDLNATGALTLILFVWIVAILSGAPDSNFYWLGLLVFVIAVLPVILAIAVTLWAATRPRADEQPA